MEKFEGAWYIQTLLNGDYTCDYGFPPPVLHDREQFRAVTFWLGRVSDEPVEVAWGNEG